MKKLLLVLPVILCSILIAAHFGRVNLPILQLVSLLVPLLLIWKSKISARIIELAIVLFGLEWIRSLIYYIRIRTEYDQDWFLLAVILGAVILANFATLLVFRSKYMRSRYKLM